MPANWRDATVSEAASTLPIIVGSAPNVGPINHEQRGGDHGESPR